jgi:hypothetical protein
MCGCCETEIDRCHCYHFENGNIFVVPGVYFIEYTIQLPSGVSAYTEVHLISGGEVIPGSVRLIEHAGDGAETVHARVVFEACEPTDLSLITTDGISLMPSMSGEQLVTMTINGFC